MSESHIMEFTAPALTGLLRTRFRQVDLMLRVFPAWAIPWASEKPLDPPRLLAGFDHANKWIKTSARRAMPKVYARLATRVHGNRDVTPQDISWVPAEDPRATDGAGLAAVCRCPIRQPGC
jgi:hypothetical protein